MYRHDDRGGERKTQQNTEVQKEPQAAALDKLMAAVGKQLDTAGQEVKGSYRRRRGR